MSTGPSDMSAGMTHVMRNPMMRGACAVIGSTATMALGFGALGLTSVFLQPLEAEFGLSRADTSLIYAIATIGMALGGSFWGRLSDRLDVRILLTIGGAGISASLISMAAVQSLWQIYLSSAILGGFGFSVLYAPLLATSGEWFPKHRGFVTGIVTAGGALGQGVMPFSASLMMNTLGWRLTYLSLGVGVLIALMTVLPFVRWPHGRAAPGAAIGGPATNLTDQQKQQVVLLATAAFLCCACMGVPLMHLANFVGTICGSPTVGATSLLAAMIAGAIGRVCFGLYADRTSPLSGYALASAMQTVCVLVYPSLGNAVSLLALSTVFGFGFAGNMTCLVICVRDAVPANRFGGAIGAVMLVAWMGMAAGGYLGGWLFDAFANYAISFAAAGIAGVLNLLIIFIIRQTRRPAALNVLQST